MEGIYRIPGSTKRINILKETFDKHEKVNLDDYKMDKAAITSAIKRYFSDLPEPIMTFGLYPKFLKEQRKLKKIKNLEIESLPERIRKIKEIIHQLPKEHYSVLKFFMNHLRLVHKHRDETKMDVKALAVVFGPTIFKAKDGLQTRFFTDIPILSGVIRTMIKHYFYIFEEGEFDERNEDEDFLLGLKTEVDLENEEEEENQEQKEFLQKQNSFFERRRRKKIEVENRESYLDLGELEWKKIEDMVNEDWKPIQIDLTQSKQSRPITSWRNTMIFTQHKVEYIEMLEEIKKDEETKIEKFRNVDELNLDELKLEKSKLKKKLSKDRDFDTMQKYKIIKRKIIEYEIQCICPKSASSIRKINLKDISENLKNNQDYIQLRKKKKEIKKKIVQIMNDFYCKNGRKMTKRDSESKEDIFVLYQNVKQQLNTYETQK